MPLRSHAIYCDSPNRGSTPSLVSSAKDGVSGIVPDASQHPVQIVSGCLMAAVASDDPYNPWHLGPFGIVDYRIAPVGRKPEGVEDAVSSLV